MKFLKKLFDFIKKLLKKIWEVLRKVLAVLAIVVGLFLIFFTPYLWWGIFLLVTAFLVDKNTSKKVFDKIGSAVGAIGGAVGGIVGDGLGGLVGGLADTPFGLLLLVGAGIWLFSALTGDKEEENQAEPTTVVIDGGTGRVLT